MPKLLLFCSFILISIFLHAQTASFTYQSANGLFCAPVTVQFTQTSTGSPTGFIWNFGNGQSSTSANPSIVFSAPGSYSVKLITLYANTASESIQTLTINPGITASLTAERNYLCMPGAVIFTANSSGNITQYEWDFGDSTAPVVGNAASVTHNYASFGVFNATVKATDIAGCVATASYLVEVKTLTITGTVSLTQGCIPAGVNFTAVADIPPGSTVTNYSWDFNDGSPVENTAAGNNAHSYTGAGTYNPVVTITTSEGCTNSYSYGQIGFGTPPTNLNAFPDKNTYCASESPLFKATATNANNFNWEFGDGTAGYGDSVSHQYSSLGTMTVFVIPNFNGCVGANASFQILITGVIAGFGYSNTCQDKNTFSFNNTSQGIINNYTWSFGDSSLNAFTQNTNHSFLSGTYTTTLIVSDTISKCSDAISENINAGASTLTNPDTSICRNASTTFSINNTQTLLGVNYTWNVVGLPAVTNNLKTYSVPATSLGNFTSNTVIINNGPQYCTDTIALNHPINVRGYNLNFSGPDSICSNSNWMVTNNSTSALPANTMVNWLWNFGQPPVSDSAFSPAPVNYNTPGNYNVKLTATDNTGCTDSLMKLVTVNPTAFVQILPDNISLCAGRADTLVAYHSGSLLWLPAGAVSCNTCDTVIINPGASRLYIARSNNIFNCSASDTVQATVFAPFTAQAVQSPVTICENDTVRINATPSGMVINWTPAQGLSNPGNYNPLASPATSTVYTATLQDSAGCFSSSADVNVIVKSLPLVDAGPDRVLPYNSPFTITPVYSSNVAQYLWSPSIGLNCNTCANPAGIAQEEQLYTITVISDSGCVASDNVQIAIECKYANLLLPTAFTPNNDGLNDVYYPIARGIRSIKRFVIFNRMGQKIFESVNIKPNEISSGWNGYFKGQQADPGAYVYFLEAVCETGNIITKKDSFILIR